MVAPRFRGWCYVCEIQWPCAARRGAVQLVCVQHCEPRTTMRGGFLSDGAQWLGWREVDRRPSAAVSKAKYRTEGAAGYGGGHWPRVLRAAAERREGRQRGARPWLLDKLHRARAVRRTRRDCGGSERQRNSTGSTCRGGKILHGGLTFDGNYRQQRLRAALPPDRHDDRWVKSHPRHV